MFSGDADLGTPALAPACVVGSVRSAVVPSWPADDGAFDGHEIATSFSVGIAICPQDGIDFATVLKRADIAMYQAKAAGRATYRLFSDQMDVAALGRHRIRNALHQAIERNEFSLHFQPQIELNASRLVGAEALLRWTNVELGSVSPADFIPIAEESGLIVPIGEWVINEACRQAAGWQAPSSARFRGG